MQHISELVYAFNNKNAIAFKKLDIKLHTIIIFLLLIQYVADKKTYTNIVTICDAIY